MPKYAVVRLGGGLIAPVVMRQPWLGGEWLNRRLIYLDDTPLFYSPSRGLPVQFQLSYRQRDHKPVDPAIFGVGTNWTSSGRVFLVDATSVQSGLFRLHRGGAGELEHYLDYYVGTPQFYDGSILSTPDGGQTYQIEYADGSKDIFAKTFVTSGNETLFFLTMAQDPAGNALTYNYDSNPNIVRLLSITDPDSRNTSFYYENASFTNHITKVVDPFSRTNLLRYDALGYLTNIVDVAGITSSFVYDAGSRRSWITNLITPYGTTSFHFGGVNADSANFYDSGNVVNRFAEVTLPNGGKHLYLYRQDCSSILAATNSSVPSTSPFANTLDNVDHDKRNSFHWAPIQFVWLSTNYLYSGNVTNLTSADYVLAGLKHWLIDPATGQASRVLSVQRSPSANAEDPGQMTWLDYAGKSGNNSNGANAWLTLEARVLPDGSNSFHRLVRNHRGWPTNEVSTYTAPNGASFAQGSSNLRTNDYLYDGNGIDLLRHVGADGNQVLSNYFNAYHQALVSYNALNEATVYTYNGNRQLTSVLTPAGLTTTNIYFPSGDDAGRLDKTIDLEIQRTNAYTYYANGLVWSQTDERGLTTYSYWDNLQRLTGTLFPDGTTTSNRYTVLDVTATKDRLGYWSYAAYNPIRLKTAETNANGVVTGYGYCDCGALLSVTNAWNTPAQMVTSFGYDAQGNRIYTYLPDATITNWYDSLKRLVMTGDAWGYEWYTYNNQGLRNSTSNSFGAKQITVFDLEDRPLYALDANGVVVTNVYDELGRLSTRTYPDGGVEKFGYSARGLTAHTNQLGQTTYYVYDEARRKTFETNANSEVIRYTNSAAGDLIALVDGKNQVTKWKYDEYGRATNKLDQAATEILRYQYDPNGRLTNRWSVAKGNTTYAYVLRTFLWSYFLQNWRRKNAGFLARAVVKIASIVRLERATIWRSAVLSWFWDRTWNLAELKSYAKFASYGF
ncbi:MAG TPA: hypothetical protein VFZ59_21985 [Verrucomicrobiae bacterium]|nr:hypothetical protein [Verrucomicrobiae bacterium]